MLLLLTFLSGQVIAQERATIQGTVYDSDSNPLPGANVTLEGTQTGTSTNADGEYQLRADAGNYTLQASFLVFRHLENLFLSNQEKQLIWILHFRRMLLARTK